MDKITTSGSALSIAKVNQKAVFFIHNVVNLQLLKVKIEGMILVAGLSANSLELIDSSSFFLLL